MTERGSRRNLHLSWGLELFQSKAHSAGQCEAELTEQSLARSIDWAIEQHRRRYPAEIVGIELVEALSLIAHALDNPRSEFRLKLVKPGRRSKRKSLAQWSADFRRNDEIALFVWSQLQGRIQSKAAFGKACDKFGASHETIYKAVRASARRLIVRRESHRESNDRLQSVGLPPFDWVTNHSSEFEKWLEAFAVASPDDGR